MTIFKALAAIGMIASLGACSQARETFGLDKSAPDEFAVVTHAPLAIPPDFGLRPPTPGALRPQEASTKNEARRILLRSGANGAAGGATGKELSRGEAALLGRAGAENADPSIRERVSRESSVLVEGDKDFIKRLIFWRKDEAPGIVIDADQESRRLRENAALGDAATKGTTVVIERKQKGFLEGIFN